MRFYRTTLQKAQKCILTLTLRVCFLLIHRLICHIKTLLQIPSSTCKCLCCCFVTKNSFYDNSNCSILTPGALSLKRCARTKLHALTELFGISRVMYSCMVHFLWNHGFVGYCSYCSLQTFLATKYLAHNSPG